MYPTDEELELITKWDPKDFKGCMAFIKTIWQFADCGYWTEENGSYEIATGGWSGNESIIAAMKENYVFWAFYWFSSRRGGLYKFCPISVVDDKEEENE